MALTGDKLVAYSAPSDQQNTAGTTSSTTYTATLAGGTTCGITFVAPPSGIVDIHNTAAVGPGSTVYAFCDFEVRQGGVIGSGTVFRAATDTTAIRHADPNFVRATAVTPVVGLTPGSTYNARQLFRINSAGPLTVQDKILAARSNP